MLYNILVNGERLERDSIIEVDNSTIQTFFTHRNESLGLNNITIFTDSYWTRPNDLVNAGIDLSVHVPETEWINLIPNAENVIEYESEDNIIQVKFNTPLNGAISSYGTPKKMTVTFNGEIVTTNYFGIPTRDTSFPLNRICFLKRSNAFGEGRDAIIIMFQGTGVYANRNYTGMWLYTVKSTPLYYKEYVPPAPPSDKYDNLKLAILNNSYEF